MDIIATLKELDQTMIVKGRVNATLIDALGGLGDEVLFRTDREANTTVEQVTDTLNRGVRKLKGLDVTTQTRYVIEGIVVEDGVAILEMVEDTRMTASEFADFVSPMFR